MLDYCQEILKAKPIGVQTKKRCCVCKASPVGATEEDNWSLQRTIGKDKYIYCSDNCAKEHEHRLLGQAGFYDGVEEELKSNIDNVERRKDANEREYKKVEDGCPLYHKDNEDE
jgi:hypothetical protein